MDAETYIGQLEQLLAEARPVPLSASVMVSRREFEEALANLRAHLPEELRQSRWVIKERDEMLQQATRVAEQMRADALVQQQRLVDETEILLVAQQEAERIVDEAREAARVLRLESEDYVDAKLANFEIVLNRTLTAVTKGRERLRGRLVSDEATSDAGDSKPYSSGELVQPGSQFYDQEQGV